MCSATAEVTELATCDAKYNTVPVAVMNDPYPIARTAPVTCSCWGAAAPAGLQPESQNQACAVVSVVVTVIVAVAVSPVSSVARSA